MYGHAVVKQPAGKSCRNICACTNVCFHRGVPDGILRHSVSVKALPREDPRRK